MGQLNTIMVWYTWLYIKILGDEKYSRLKYVGVNKDKDYNCRNQSIT